MSIHLIRMNTGEDPVDQDEYLRGLLSEKYCTMTLKKDSSTAKLNKLKAINLNCSIGLFSYTVDSL